MSSEMSLAKEAANVFEMTGADNSTAGAANVPETDCASLAEEVSEINAAAESVEIPEELPAAVTGRVTEKASLAGLYAAGTKILSESEIAEARLDAWYLLEHVTGVTKAVYFADPDRTVLKEEETEYLSLIWKRAEHIPLQHIIGEQVFMGLPFFVNTDVLVPRQDTEVLCETALAWLAGEYARRKSAGTVQNRPESARDQQTKPASPAFLNREIKSEKESAGISEEPLRILDLCTGSGCILISLLSFAKEQGICAEGTGADISRAALNVAKKNAERNSVQAEWKQSDLFADIAGRFDLIVSNPPYIRTADIENLAPEVKDHDPRLALDGGADGFAFYRKIIRESPAYIRPGGLLSLEIGMDQGGEVSRMMAENGWKNVQVKKDLAGLDRVVTGVYT